MSVEEAKEKIDSFLDEIALKDLPEGIQIENPQKNWNGNLMNISFKARKSFIRIDVNGRIEVLDDRVIIELTLPAIVTSFVSEEKIKESFVRKAKALLSA